MEIIQGFFPYQYFGSPFKQAINPWFLSAIAMAFVYCIARLSWRLYRLRRVVRRFSEELDQTAIEKSPILSKAWSDYCHTFFKSENNQDRTVEDAEEFFGAQVLLNKQLNLRFWAAAPGMFLGLGIFGTFLGLTLGIHGFDTSSNDKIAESIQQLLDGMSTAFLTSLYGMAFSIFLIFFEKNRMGRTSECIHSLCENLDAKYKLSQAETIQSKDSRLWRVLRSLLVDRGEGGDILPAHVLRDMLRNSEEQTRALKSFSTDLADGIMISTETIERMGNQIGSTIGADLERSLLPMLTNLADAVDQLRNEKQESSGEFIAGIVENLGDTVTSALNQVSRTFTENTVKQMEELATTVSEAGKSFSEVPGQIEQSMKLVSQGMAVATEAFIHASETAITHLDSVVSRYTETAETSKHMLLSLTETLGAFDEASENLQAGVTGMTAHMQQLGNASSTLERATGSFEERFNEFSRDQRAALDALSNTLQQAERLVTANAQHVRELESGLSSVFVQIKDGLEGYRVTTKDSINDYLSTMARESSSSISSLAGCLEELRDVLEDFDKDSRAKGSAN